MTLVTDTPSFNMLANIGSKRFIRVLGVNSTLEPAQQLSASLNPVFHRHRDRLFASVTDECVSTSALFNSQPSICNSNVPTKLSSQKSHEPGAFYPNHESYNLKNIVQVQLSENYDRIQNALQDESSYFVSSGPLFQVDRISEDKVDANLRDEALDKLRTLHTVLYRLSTELFCKTSTLLDLFCTRVRVRTKYVTLVAAACYYIIAQQQKTFQNPDTIQPTAKNLVLHLKCGGSKADLEKMVQIIFLKLKGVEKTGASLGTHKHFLDAFYQCIVNHHYKLKYAHQPASQPASTPSLLYRKLELVLCSSSVNLFRPSCIALALLYIESLQNDHSIYYPIQSCDIYRLANLCKISREELKSCTEAMLTTLPQQTQANHFGKRQASSNSNSPPLIWTLSKRSLRAHGLIARASSSGSKLGKIEEEPILEWEHEQLHLEGDNEFCTCKIGQNHSCNRTSHDEILCGLLTPMLLA
ncbi:cyclin G2 [Cichlidogyrus casuarinus]|uniref:Cyclin G2 n=1 Tax=Cichlidogyrus casuarinus TaxID=1844966 RepID=A0ABD2Q6J7_9PLAT